MGREGENLAPGAGEPPSAAGAHASGAALGGQHGGVYFPSGTKGQQPLVFPALAGLRGRAAALGKWCRAHRAAATGVPCGTPHARIVTLWAETTARWLGRRTPGR